MPENIKTAAYAAQLSAEERKKIDDFNKAYAAHKELSDLPSNIANQVFNSKTPEQQADLIKNFGNEDPTVKQQRGWLGTAWHYTGGAVANAIGIAGSKTLAGLGNVSDFMTRVARTGLIAADQNVALIGAGGAWDIANDKGDKVFSPGRIGDAKALYGSAAVDVAMRIAAGETPESIFKTATKEQQKYIMLADPRQTEIPGFSSDEVAKQRGLFQDTLDSVNAAKYSPGRVVANAVLPKSMEGSGFFYKAISGTTDAAFRIFADPLLGASKLKRGYDFSKYALDVVVGGGKVTEVFSKASVISFWDKYGILIKDLNTAISKGDVEAAAIVKKQMQIMAPELGSGVIESLRLAQVPVTNAKAAQAFFENTQQLGTMLAGGIGRKRIILPRLDLARKTRIAAVTGKNKLFSIDEIGPQLVDDLFFGSPTTADGIAEVVSNGQKQILDVISSNKPALLSGKDIKRRIDKLKAKLSIAPLFKDDILDVMAKDAPEKIYRLARLVLPQRESRLISEAFFQVDDVGKKKDMFYGLWETIAEMRGLNTTASGQKIVRSLRKKGEARFSVSGPYQDMGSLPSDFNTFVTAPSLIDIDRAAARSGFIGRVMGQANKEWVSRMTAYWSFLTLAGPRYALRNAGEDLMVHIAIGESAWGIAKSRMLSTRLNTVTSSEEFATNPLGVALRFINKKEVEKNKAAIIALSERISISQKEIKVLKTELKLASTPADKLIIQNKIDVIKKTTQGGVVGQTRQIFAQALTEGKVNRFRAKLGLKPANKKEAEYLSEQIIYGDIENTLAEVSEGGMNFASGGDYISNVQNLTKSFGVRTHNLEFKLPKQKYTTKQGERGYKAQAISSDDEASMVVWGMRINYFANDTLGSIAVANLDNDAVAISKMIDWMTTTKAGEKFLKDSRLSNKMSTEGLAKLNLSRAKENFYKEDGKTLNLDLLNKIRVKDVDTGNWQVSGKISLDDLPTDPTDIPRSIIGPVLVPAVNPSEYTANIMTKGWNWMGMANARMSRQPLVINEMIRIRKEFDKTGFDKAWIKSYTDVIDPTNIKSIEKATIKAKKDLALIIEERALGQTLTYIDNPLVRTQAAFAARNLARFYRATEDFYRRFYRTVRYNPEAIVKGALTYEGVTHSGWVQKDDQGQDYFVYPGIAPVYNAIQNTLERIGIKGEFKVPFPVQFGSQIKMLTPSLNPDSMIPTFSGPLAGVSVQTLSSIVNIWSPGAADSIKGYTLGKYSVDQPFLSALLPAHVNRFYAALNTNDRNSQYASAWRKAVTYLEASGNGLPKNLDEFGNLIPPTKAEQEAYRLAVKNTTLGILSVRFAFGFFAPASPQVQLKSDMAQWISDNGRASWKQTFNNLRNEYSDPDLAMAKWVELFPNQVPYTVSESERKSIAPLRYADEAGFFVDQNKGLFKDYPAAAAFLIPHKSGFSWDAYKTMKDMGLRYNKRVDDYLLEVQTSADLQTYFARKDQYESALEQSGADFERSLLRKEFDEWKSVFYAGHPLVQDELSGGSQKAIDRIRTLDELNIMLAKNLNIAPKTESKLRQMSKLYQSYRDERANYEEFGGNQQLIKMLKEDTIIQLRTLASYNENTKAAYDVLFGRLLGD